MAPYIISVMFGLDVVNDSLFNEMRGYKYLEDYPMLNSMYNNPELQIYVHEKPLVLYRLGSGISTDPNHNQRGTFKEEEKRINKEICIHYRDNMFLNPYQYFFHFEKRFNEIFLYRNNRDIKNLIEEGKDVESQVNEYLRKIRCMDI